jgi:hypothetical protein
MTITRARITDVHTAVQPLLRQDAAAAAGNNALISRAEQAAAPAHVQSAAEQVRSAGGARARVTVDAVEQVLGQQARALIAGVNQSSGSGATFLSLAEAQAAAARNPSLGAHVLRARELVLGKSVDVDGIAAARVQARLSGNDGIFKTFATQHEAERFRGPPDTSVFWLVVEGESATTKSFVQGCNDLWSERFDISKVDGSVVVTAEH